MSPTQLLKSGSPSSSMSPLEQQREEDSDWALEHYGELVQRYPGQYLLVWRRQVIDHGPDPGELLRRSATPQRPREELVVVAFPDPFSEIPH